ncbi:hypothetical protein N7457_007647 [Penicillium paradoxum]|uniref:uncharacterized protein n=1 Tax=Penicillium paradoxum TaxID=176176 RepID=UPI0025476991|nr:uncharacterized protein N7457_007647 [Penicillium paradoxum]KAJ5772751.1 hypothetical protein N7457_007647 [Penicillium paradoxum]
MHPVGYLLDDEGHHIKHHTIIGSGRGVVVVRRDDVAVKMAIVHASDSFKDVEANRRKIRAEQAVWRRVQPNFTKPVQGIVHCLDLPGDTIELKYMSGGTLGQWLSHREPPRLPLQKKWIRQLAIGLHNLHQRRVIHCDILPRNLLLDDAQDIMIMDLGASTAMPLSTVMVDAVDRYNCSMWTDLCQLGLVIYQIVTGRPHGVRIYHSRSNGDSVATFPSRQMLPAVGKDVWAREIIETCWKKRGYGAAGAAGIVATLDRMKICS